MHLLSLQVRPRATIVNQALAKFNLRSLCTLRIAKHQVGISMLAEYHTLKPWQKLFGMLTQVSLYVINEGKSLSSIRLVFTVRKVANSDTGSNLKCLRNVDEV